MISLLQIIIRPSTGPTAGSRNSTNRKISFRYCGWLCLFFSFTNFFFPFRTKCRVNICYCRCRSWSVAVTLVHTQIPWLIAVCVCWAGNHTTGAGTQTTNFFFWLTTTKWCRRRLAAQLETHRWMVSRWVHQLVTEVLHLPALWLWLRRTEVRTVTPKKLSLLLSFDYIPSRKYGTPAVDGPLVMMKDPSSSFVHLNNICLI